MAQQILEVRDLGVQVVVVVGGGNIFRGLTGSERGIERATGDYMGMLATIINALALQDSLEKLGVPTRIQSAITMAQVAESFIRRRAVRHLEKGRVVTSAAARAILIFQPTRRRRCVPPKSARRSSSRRPRWTAFTTAIPRKVPKAKRFDQITYLHALQKQLKVMDATAFADNKMPIIVFDFFKAHNLKRVVMGEKVGTLVTS